MTKHNALRMLGRSGNPTLSDATFAGFETVEAKNHDPARHGQQSRGLTRSRGWRRFVHLESILFHW